MTKRRDFLIQCATATAWLGSSLPAMAVRFADESAPVGPAETLERFERALGQTYRLTDLSIGSALDADLVAIEDRATRYNPSLKQFVLVFRGRSGVPIPEGIYQVVGRDGTASHLFLQPRETVEGRAAVAVHCLLT